MSSQSNLKLYTFNAGSFTLEPAVEKFLRSKNAISLDIRASAYINPEAMPAILSELIEKLSINSSSNTDLVSDLKAEVCRIEVERQKLRDDNAYLTSQLESEQLEVSTLREKAANDIAVVEALKAENARLQAALKDARDTTANKTTASKIATSITSDDKIKQSYAKLQKEFQLLRSQSVEAIASLKVLEEENEELRIALDELKNQNDVSISEIR